MQTCSTQTDAVHSQLRAGLTLLEVLLSIAILGGAVAAIGPLTSNALRAAVRADAETDAAVRCQSQLDALLAGSLPLQSTPPTVCADDAQWSWSAELVPHTEPRLMVLTVTVQRSDADRTGARCSLQRLVRSRGAA
jgi:general secretion pathway protein I